MLRIDIQVTETYGSGFAKAKGGSGDYAAIDGQTYDGPGSAIGSGHTPAAAIQDLIDQLADAGDLTMPETEQ